MSTLDFYQLSLLHFAALSRSMNHSENQPLLKILLFIPFQHCGCRYDSPYMLGLLHICVYAARTLKGYRGVIMKTNQKISVINFSILWLKHSSSKSSWLKNWKVWCLFFLVIQITYKIFFRRIFSLDLNVFQMSWNFLELGIKS